MTAYIDHPALLRALHLRDLTDPLQGPHAMQLLLSDIHTRLVDHWHCQRLVQRTVPIVAVADNYDRLAYPPGAAARDARYTRYLDAHHMLRSHMSALIPGLLRGLAPEPPADLLLACPGLVYRRDAIDRLHVGEPHQLDLWRLARHRLNPADLAEMVRLVVAAALPGYRWRTVPASHPYTTAGLQIDVQAGDGWVEIGECGLAAPAVLALAGLDPARISGLAMGLGLDRLLMLRKGITDIRLLRAGDPRIARQMLDLAPYRPVSNQPAIRRDLSVAVDEDITAEELGDRVRQAMAEQIDALESLDLVEETTWAMLPAAARERMGMQPGQKNVLLRLTIRHPIRTLTSAEANAVRNRVYTILHQGQKMEWAAQ